jgi:hypothetical protein
MLLLLCLLPAAQAFTATRPHALSTSFQTAVTHSSSSRIAVHSLDGFLQEFFPEEADNWKDKKKTNARHQKSPPGESAAASSSTTKSRFATGDELQSLRMDLESLRENLQWAQALNDRNSMDDLRKAIQNGENRDPDTIFQKAYQEIAKAKDNKLLTDEEREALVEKWTSVAAEARGYLPRFSLEGLWVGE